MLKEIGKDMAMKYKFIIDHNRAKRGKILPCVGVFLYNRQERKPGFLN